MRYYVAMSSIFNSIPYNISRIKAEVKAAGGSNIRTAYKFGWGNQPRVVTFNASPEQVKLATEKLTAAFDTQWILIYEKDW